MLADVARDTAAPTWTIAFGDEGVPPLANRPGMDLAAWQSELDRMTGRRAEKRAYADPFLEIANDYFTSRPIDL